MRPSPSPDSRDVAVQEALADAAAIAGSWQGDEIDLRRHVTLNVTKEFGALYLRETVRGDVLWSPLLVLTFDTSTRRYVLLTPKSGGFEVADVSHPKAHTWSWITHLDGPAIRTTLTVDDSGLRRRVELIHGDGSASLEADVVLQRSGPVSLQFVSPQ